MELLQTEAPIIWWIVHTLWQVLSTAFMCLLIFLGIALAVYLCNRAKAC